MNERRKKNDQLLFCVFLLNILSTNRRRNKTRKLYLDFIFNDNNNQCFDGLIYVSINIPCLAFDTVKKKIHYIFVTRNHTRGYRTGTK